MAALGERIGKPAEISKHVAQVQRVFNGIVAYATPSRLSDVLTYSAMSDWEGFQRASVIKAGASLEKRAREAHKFRPYTRRAVIGSASVLKKSGRGSTLLSLAPHSEDAENVW